AIRECLAGRKVLQGLGDQWEIETVTYHLHLCHMRAGRLAEANAEADKLLELSREIRDAKFEALALAGLGRLVALGGDYRRGLQIVDDAVKASPDALSIILSLGHKGAIYLQRDDFTSAREALEEATDLVAENRLVQDYTAVIATALAEAIICEAIANRTSTQPIAGKTLRRCAKAVKTALKQGKKYPSNLPAALLASALLAWAKGKGQRALSLLDESTRAATKLGAKLQLAHAEAMRGRFLTEMAHPTARKHIEAACALYEESEAWAYLARTRRRLEPTPSAAALPSPETHDRSKFLVEMVRTLSNTLDLDLMLTQATGLMKTHFGADYTAIYLPEEDEDGGRPLRLRCPPGVGTANVEQEHAVQAAWENGRVVRAAQPDDTALSPRPAPATTASRQTAVGIIALPLPHREDLVGVLYLRRAAGKMFDDDVQSTLEVAAGQLGMSIASAQAQQTITKLRRRLKSHTEAVAEQKVDLASSRSALRERAVTLEHEVTHRTDSLRRTISELERARKSSHEVVTAVSAHLREPMYAILGSAEGLASATDQQREAALGNIRRHAGQTLVVLDALEDMGAIDRGAMSVSSENISLDTFLADVESSARPFFIDRPELIFKIHRPDVLPPLLTDAAKLQQVLMYLFDNAARCTPGGQVSLTVDVTSAEMVFAVRDSGIGIRNDQLGQVFNPFYRGDDVGGASVVRLGLGLTLAQRIMRLLGGNIRVESTRGTGSVFRVVHPRERAASVTRIGQKMRSKPNVSTILPPNDRNDGSKP
ncbi:MAG: signal transduction histidine kinase/tetratricopeptide (TPR) repeat protein, partial [Myxococcota bacterium]